MQLYAEFDSELERSVTDARILVRQKSYSRLLQIKLLSSVPRVCSGDGCCEISQLGQSGQRGNHRFQVIDCLKTFIYSLIK